MCKDDAYFQELVRYIHLNPLRAKIVKDLSSLNRYPWHGHSVVMGRRKHEWQNVNNEKVLSDERILGSGEFVEKLIEEADDRILYGHYFSKEISSHNQYQFWRCYYKQSA